MFPAVDLIAAAFAAQPTGVVVLVVGGVFGVVQFWCCGCLLGVECSYMFCPRATSMLLAHKYSSSTLPLSC